MGWGETPLSVQWVWPSSLSYDARNQVLLQLTERLAAAWARFDVLGAPDGSGRGVHGARAARRCSRR